MPDPVPPDIAAALAASAARRGGLGDPIVYFEETGSTNDVAARLADQGAGQGTLVVAGRQTSGRGRMGRVWFSPAGAGLYASLVLRSERAAPYVTLAGGVAVAEGITAATALPVEIKWPNDVVVADTSGRWRKISGILAEASTGARGLQHVILGIGINLRPAAYPPELGDRATSIETELGRPVDAGPVLAEVLASLARSCAELEADRPSAVLDRWRDRAPGLAGRGVFVDGGHGRVRGTVIGLGDDGALMVSTGDGVRRVISGEVVWT